jgi:two-component system, NtrC family, nitrogen regulation response regulator GlnG
MVEDDGLDQETRDPQLERSEQTAPRTALTILHHPDIERVGERAFIDRGAKISRLEPIFSSGRPLADPFISRSPIPVEGDSAKGEVIEVGARAVLFLHQIAPFRESADRLDMIGESQQMHALRWEILRVARSDLPVLIRGETGTGKEHVARALHARGLHPDGPFVAVNMAAIQPSLAASALFGHAKGAFTGADSERIGLFERAHGGTLFMDEIGEAPVEVQVMLLRILETGKLEPVGGSEERAVSVRLIAATDADLHRLAASGKMRPALLHRLAGYELFLPPLRSRREDIGRFAAHFYRAEYSPEGEWLPAPVMAFLARQDWPGNVRQLANVIRRLGLMSDLSPDEMIDHLKRSLSQPEQEEPREAETSARKPQDVSEEEVFEAMKASGWRMEKAAERLGISRPSLYRLVEAHPLLRTAKDLTQEELLSAHREAKGDADRMSELLRVSRAGIQQRLRQLKVE